MTELEAKIAATAATDPLAFAALADLAEERGEPAEVCLAIRDLRLVANDIRYQISRLPERVEYRVHLDHYGTWRLWWSRPVRRRSPWFNFDSRQVTQGLSLAVRVAIRNYGAALAGLEALGHTIGFGYLATVRNGAGTVSEVRFIHV